MSKRFKGKICVYCVKNLSTNQGDHIFAREFFLPNRRQNLPKVPACKQCNGDKSKLEHYLTSILPFGGRHGDARSNIELVPKRLAKNARLRRLLVDGRKAVWSKEKSGLYVPTTTLPIKPGCIEQLFEFIVKGLVWYHWQIYLSSEHFVKVMVLTKAGEDAFEQRILKEKTNPYVSAAPGNGTFLYEGIQDATSPEATAWRFSVYGGLKLGGDPQAPLEESTRLGGFTGPKQILSVEMSGITEVR